MEQGPRPAVPARDGMPPWIPRLVFLVIGSLAVAYFAFWALGRMRGVLINLLVALFLSFALEPAVVFLARRGWKRGLATAVVFLGAAIVGALFVAVTLPPLVTQIGNLVSEIPNWVTTVTDWLNNRFNLSINLSNLTDSLSNLQGTLQSYAGTLANSALGLGSRVLSLVVQMLTIGLFTFYLLADGPRWRRMLLSVFRPGRQKEIARMWEIAIDKTGGYVYSRALLALASAIFTYVALRIIGVEFALALSIWVGVVSQFVPAVGTYLAAVAPTLVALGDSVRSAVIVLAVLVVYQQIENLLLAPRITAGTMSLHPAVAFGSVLVGAALLGVVGALIALPATATLQAFVSTFIERHQVEESMIGSDRASPDRPDPPDETDEPGPESSS